MPVTDLADYLGMPQQAPANPVFNQTRRSTGMASLDRQADDIYKGGAAMDQLYRLQRQAPVLQAQQAQLAYDEVAQQANDLRMKQEIEAQVERAANELAGGNLNPESDDFAVKYRDFATRNPLAFSDPRFKGVAGLYEDQFKANQETRRQRMEAEARATQARIDAANSARAFGVPENRITDDMSIRDIQIERGKWKNENAGTKSGAKDITGQMMEKDFQLIDEDWRKMKEDGENVIYDAKGVEMPNPEFQKLDEERRILKEKLRGFYKGKYSPETASTTTETATQQQVNPSAAATRLALTAMASAATPFAPAAFPSAALANALPQVQSPVTQAVAPSVPDDGTGELRSIISNPDVPEVDRNVAFTELKTLLESQTPPKGSTFTEIAKFKNDLKERIDTARVDLEANRFREMVAPVWTGEKDIVAKAIKRMAQDLGAEEDTVIASLFPRDKNGKPAEQQKIPMSIVPKEMQPMKRDKFGEREMYVKDLLAAYLADQRGKNPADASYEKDSKAKIEGLSGWMEEAEKDTYPDKEVYKKAIRKVGLDADRTQEDVIREYVKSMALPVATASPQVNVAPKAVKTSTGNTATLKSSQ